MPPTTSKAMEKVRRECAKYRLSVRQQEAVQLLLDGETLKGAASRMGCSIERVKQHRRRIRQKIGEPTLIQALFKLLVPQR
jgi:DNA-binding CsgD family transcriptional regulator